MTTKSFLLLPFFISVFLNVKGQDKVYTAIEKTACACMGNKAKLSFKATDLKACLSGAMEQNAELIQQEVLSRFPDSLTYQKGYEWGQQIGMKLDTALVYSCDVY